MKLATGLLSSSMQLDVLPVRADQAAANMATDFLLLQRYPASAHLRFRHYGWQRPAFTFGFSQKIATVRAHVAQLGADEAELCRRPTGGGIVDHRHDWTYALVVPRGHVVTDAPAIEGYRLVHAALAATLAALGVPAELQTSTAEPADERDQGPAGVCFQRAECCDVIHTASRRKIAGAALKRTKRGLLFQGSLAREEVGALDFDALLGEFPVRLARAFSVGAQEVGWPEWVEEELSGLTEQYASAEWNEHR